MSNPFGGKNEKSLYVPMSETEQEALSRLVESKSLEVVVHGWGLIENPSISFGDKRISIPVVLPVQVSGPVSYFDLELRSRDGFTLFRERQSALYNGAPLQLVSGTELSMIWDIGIKAMNPAFVKAVVPGAVGLTSRSLDRDTGKITAQGNYLGLSPAQKKILETIHRGEQRLRGKKS